MLFFHYVVRKVSRRMGNNALTILVIGLVVAGCILGVAFLLGLREAARESLPAGNIVVTSRGAADESVSNIAQDTLHQLEVLPGIRGTDIKAVSPELAARALLDADMTNSGSEEAIILRGVQATAFDVHGVKIVEGRMPADNATELLVGVQARARYPGLKLGAVIKLPHEDWTIVGFFSAGGSLYEGELWADRDRVGKPLKNERVNSVTLTAASAGDAATLIEKINSSKAFEASAKLEREFRGSQAQLGQVTKLVALLVLIMCLLGTFVTATNLHASLVTRMPELASLIVLGVRRGRVAGLVLLESLGLSLMGAVLAVGLALLAQGRSTAALASDAVFQLHVGLIPIAVGVALAVLIGFIGGVFPSYLARRMDLLHGLRG